MECRLTRGPITASSASENTIAVATVVVIFITFLFKGGKISETGKMTVDADIMLSASVSSAAIVTICAVGLWSTKVLLVELGSGMKVCHIENLSLDVRSKVDVILLLRRYNLFTHRSR